MKHHTTEDSERWAFTVIRTQGLHFMRPERSWRPIITVEVDKDHQHETVLGTDGQNPNLKAPFYLRQADLDSKVEIKIWHKSESKKKTKKRNLVATACHSLGELLKRQELESKVEVRLICQSTQKRCKTSSRGKPQNGAVVLLRLRPPPGLRALTELEDDLFSSASPSTGALSIPSTAPQTPVNEPIELADEDTSTYSKRKKTRLKGFFSDDETCEEDETLYDENTPLLNDKDISYGFLDDDSEGCTSDQVGTLGWVMASLLPQYTEKIEVPGDMSLAETFLASFTLYGEFRLAQHDSQFDAIFRRLQQEWTFVGGLLVALAAVDTAVFSISPGGIFDVSPWARKAIAASSIASGLGISCATWFLLRYNWADLQTFISRAKDVYDSYIFFSLSARVPSLCMLASAISLMGFLGLVAFDAWPEGVVAVCFLIGIIMTLQFLAYGAHWCVRRVLDGGRTVLRCGAKVGGWITSGPRSVPAVNS